MSKLLLLNGPNLNLLGTREPDHYGRQTLEDINSNLIQQAQDAGHHLECFQSNAEYQLIDAVHEAYKNKINFIIINPAALTHTSVALRDAILGVNIPFIELHLSNVYKREEFRHHSFFSDIAVGVISGLGAKGYELALEYACFHLENKQ
ncbi:MAG: type II 3-dehydroquinate dehydratase [gamma proteobacterium symbiont of Taylorina sp.]|nr:type II 3-dehydroquinate dehydratase [gamma proteobacterium symbiont of Taylorina sp.]